MSNTEERSCIDESKLIEDIKTYGWSVVLIEGTAYLPSFGYTVGLWKNYNHPELIAFGLTTQTLHSILNIGGDIVKESKTLQTNCGYDDFFESSPVQFIPVDSRSIKDYFSYATRFNQASSYPALQLVWTDRNNKFPWDRDFEQEFAYRQPLLDRNADFKYREAKNLAVFTTRQWVEEKKPILRVVHDEEGDWQFLTGDQLPEDIKIVALEQLILNDSTLNDVFNLDYGEAADREFIGDKWNRDTVSNE